MTLVMDNIVTVGVTECYCQLWYHEYISNNKGHHV